MAATAAVGEIGVIGGNTRKWYQWGKSALEKLAEAEAGLFATAGAQLLSRFIPIDFKNSKIYTVSQSATIQKSSEPIVLIHGFGAGVAIWSRSIATLARHHTVHAIDILGFGRSSRPKFSNDPEVAEKELVESIENWRSAMDIDKMHLVAHSFGGYLASQYALEYPDRVKHLILVDPWGYSEKRPDNLNDVLKRGGMRAQLINFALKFNPFAILRVTGSHGPQLIKRFRPDLQSRYPGNHEDDIYNYIYYCNSQTPSGEIAFKNMSHLLGWAKRPMEPRFRELHAEVPVTFILGGHSWIDPDPALRLQKLKPRQIEIKVIRNAGHHVYADATAEFNLAIHSIVDKYLE